MTRTSRTAIGPKAATASGAQGHQQQQQQQETDEGPIDGGRRSRTSSVELEDEMMDAEEGGEQTEATANQTATTTTNSSVNTGQSRVQIIASDRPPASYVSGDNESVGSASKRRSNSQFTVPSVSRTSITTVSPSIQSSDAASTNTQPSSSLAPLQQTPTSGGMDTASVITIASSSKHHSRRSFDTNASTMAIAPESLLSRGGSMDSLPNKSLTSSRHLSTASPSFKTDDDDVSIQSGAIVGGATQSPIVDDASSSHWK